jgi:hypothetical protein
MRIPRQIILSTLDLYKLVEIVQELSKLNISTQQIIEWVEQSIPVLDNKSALELIEDGQIDKILDLVKSYKSSLSA